MGQAETIFFKCMDNVIGEDWVLSKSVGKKISKSDLFLDKNLERNDFPHHVKNHVRELLLDLGSNEPIPSGSIAHNIDGMIIDHPNFKTRIVEFDEIQHFNPFRLITIAHLRKISPALIPTNYEDLCVDKDVYLRMLKKHRLAAKMDSPRFKSQEEFYDLIQIKYRDNNGYIAPRKGFSFKGGRIAQRAYYDSLRDIAHFSSHNKHLSQIWRFSQISLERAYQKDFLKLSEFEVSAYIEKFLKNESLDHETD